MNGTLCEESITYDSVANHFAKEHGMKAWFRSPTIHCKWSGCSRAMKRENFMRHIREVHMGRSRRGIA
ncbi:hypothetical protein ID866_5495 [Astraeus odoratus]|nr:hypothetical protein ID866_5495 [Astraeus odoratus]